jgi:beta-galactosidase/beta-glucuronidase
MKHILISLIINFTVLSTFAQWKPAGDKIKTNWAEDITPTNVHSEYPRPIMERGDWINLNGLWNYAITELNSALPNQFDGKILVPFPVESSLSGVQKTVGESKNLWYSRDFQTPANWKEKKTLLHFGAVDWKTEVWINDIKVGSHVGGFTPFSFDITPYLKKTGSQNLTVKVWDPTDKGPQARGKQVSNPNSIWYTPVTGIWQTVWLEPVSNAYITKLHTVPDIDKNRLSVNALISGGKFGDIVEVKVLNGNTVVSKARSGLSNEVEVYLDNPKLWSPETPFLYNLEVTLLRDGKAIDHVKSYAAMRKISTKRDESGIVRLQLNNKDYFHFGPLDQGWWPDGLYTAPSDEALRFDIQKTKDLGYNMIRKHVKVEPARWYTHCDQIGILVWQDMPSGDQGPNWQNRDYFNGIEFNRSAESETFYRKEWQDIIDFLYSYPSIAVWVPFNEAWGQFKTKEISEWTKTYDPSRLVNPASGGNHYPVGDMLDLHNYPAPELYLFDGQRANVLGEYGGIGLAMDGHLWEPNRNWGYVQFKTSEEATDEYIKYAEQLKSLIKTGFSAAVYTQTTDVEIEVNGLMTYDRKVIKLNPERIRKVNLEISNILNKEK